MLKSEIEIEIAPVFHLLPERMPCIYFMALVLHRLMRQRLCNAGSQRSPEATLQQLRRVQRHPLRIDDAAPIDGISTIRTEQADSLAALKIKPPALHTFL